MAKKILKDGEKLVEAAEPVVVSVLEKVGETASRGWGMQRLVPTASLPGLVSELDRQVPLHRVMTPWLDAADVTLDLLRIDQLDPQISGNKWYKLKYNILHAHQQGKKTIISFGGAWSNHIHALAFAGNRLGIDTIGVIRGERSDKLSATLVDAEQLGMQSLRQRQWFGSTLSGC